MKKVVILLVAVTIFMLCASVGYEMATRTTALVNGDQATGVPAQGPTSAPDKPFCLAALQVDRLESDKPHLISAWAVLMFFDQQPNKINVNAAYLPGLNTDKSKALEKAFTLDKMGAPSADFMRAFQNLVPDCKDYVLIDEAGVVKSFNWLTGQTDMQARLDQSAGDNERTRALLKEACDKLTGSAKRQLPPFRWADLAPDHIRTNLITDTALLYWDRAVNAPSPDTCIVNIK